MADSGNGPSGPKKPKTEISMEQRLLLAFVLMGLVLFATQWLYPPAPQNTVKTTKQATPKQAAKPEAPPPAPVEPVAATQVAAEKEETFTIDTDVFKVVLSNRGAVVRSWTLKHYRDGAGKPLDLVNPLAAPKAGYPLTLTFKDRQPAVDVNGVLFAAKPAPDGLGIDYDYSNGKVTAQKRLRFLKNSYLTEITTVVQENGSGIPHLIAWRGGFGDPSVAAAHAQQKTLYYDLSARKLVENNASEAKDGPAVSSGQFSFAGIEDTYFAAVLLPKGNRSVEVQTLSAQIPVPGGKEEPHVGVAVGGDARNQFSLFVGPKDLDLLKRVDAKLVDVVDFGWFSFIAKPLFLALQWLNSNYVQNYGWSIVIITVIINFLLLPLKFTSMRSMKKMSAVQPQIKAIQEKYAAISIRDPRKAQQNQEMIDLYKKYGINPASGCVPLLLQIPFFFAFYKVLSVAIELRGANWLWVADLSQPETLPIRILPLAMIGTQFWLQKMTPATTADPAQQRIMLLMPLMMGFMFYGVSSGLVLYWLTGNVVGLAQQYFFNKMGHTPVPEVVEVKPVGKKKPRA